MKNSPVVLVLYGTVLMAMLFFFGVPAVAVAAGTVTGGAAAPLTSRVVTLPPVNLVRDDGKSVAFATEIDDGRPVYLNFIFTNCQAICPATSQTFSQLQRCLVKTGKPAHLVSVSLDPDYDTPARLREYAAQFYAGRSWQHYTGTVAASVAVQKAFGAWRGDKMNHEPVTFFRLRPGAAWERVDGFATAEALYISAAVVEMRPRGSGRALRFQGRCCYHGVRAK